MPRLVASMVLLSIAGAAYAGPNSSPTPIAAPSKGLLRYDISFQDGRTQSLIGGGLADSRGVITRCDPEDLGPVVCCFDHDNPPPPDMQARVQQYMQGSYDSRYLLNGSWSAPNSPISLTWSFVPDGLSIPGGVGEATAPSILFSRMDSLFSGLGGRATWIAQIQSCFDRWSSVSGMTYTRVRDAAGDDWDDGAAWGSGSGTNRGDFRISMHNIDGVNGVLAYCQFPTNGDMVIDSSETWSQGSPSYVFLRNVVMHEHGHGLGFAHTCPANGTKLMEPFIYTGYDGPQQDELRGVSVQYGDAYEPNGSPAAAYDLGTLTPGSNTVLGNVPAPAVASGGDLAISTTGDNDYFKFTLADPKLMNFTAQPVGSSYAMYAQDSACSTTTLNDNALAAADLQMTVYNSNGTTVLRTQNATGAGSAETITGLLLASGLNYVKVNAASFTEAQLYRLTVTVQNTSLTPTTTLGFYDDHVHITWPAISDATSYQVYRNTTNALFGGTAITVAAPATSYDDFGGTPGQVYYYFVKVQQPGNTGYRFTTDSGITGYSDADPIADAGPDQTVTDTDNSGSEMVTLDGSASAHAGPGSISNYRWLEGVTILASGSSPTANVSLSVGDHTITLVVTDNHNFTGTDTVVVHVVPPSTSHCGSADFNCDGDVGTDADIEAFFACLAGNCPAPPCQGSADFNGDGDVGTDADIEAFFRVLAGGTC